MNYIVNHNTFYIMYDGKYTIINEYGKEILINGNIIDEILNNSCIYYGSTLKGRIIASKKLINSNYKVPIIINESCRIIFFKVNSDNKIIFFNYNNIKNYIKKGFSLYLEFIGGYNKTFIISWNIFNNQMLKSMRLLMILLAHSNKKYL